MKEEHEEYEDDAAEDVEVVASEGRDEPEEPSSPSSTLQQYSIPASIVVAGVIIGIAIMISGGGGGVAPTAALPTADGTGGHAAGDPSSVGVDDDPVLGDANAPVTIIEFSDYQCPFCRQFWQQTLPLIKENYIDTGAVRFVYRDFPLNSIHPDAQLAAEAAECAGDQGLYWQAHDVLFEEQSFLGQGTVRYTQSDIELWFTRIPGLDVGRVSSCIDNGEKTAEVNADKEDGTAGGVTGTPGFIVNGQVISGALPFEAFQQVIEAALAAQ